MEKTMTEDATGAESAVESAEVSQAASEETTVELTEATEDDGPKDEAESESTDENEDAETAEADTDAESDEVGDEAEGEDEAVEMVEFNFGGNKLEIPKGSVPSELADKIKDFTDGSWSKFTKDQQANVEKAKSLEARETAVAKLNTMNGEMLETYSKGLQVRQEIEQLQKIERPTSAQMDDLYRTDKDQYRRVSDQYADVDRRISEKQAEFQNISAQVGQQENAVDQAQQETTARRNEEGETQLNRYVKDFGVTEADAVVKYAMDDGGFPQEEADKWRQNPVVTKWAHKAMLYDRMQAKAVKPAHKPVQAKPVKPIKSKGAASGAKKSPENMSVSEMRKHLNLTN